jgi:hypothetical protein
VVTGAEILESALPSGGVASGAPAPAPSAAPAANGSGHAARLDARQMQALRTRVGSQYADALRGEHVEEYLALLGEEHVFKCEVHA